MRVLSEILGLKRPRNFFPTLGVPTRYSILNGKYPTNVDGLNVRVTPITYLVV